jgi:integrase
MARTKDRETIAPGVYRDHGCIEIRATSNGQTLIERLPGDTAPAEAIRLRAKLKAKAKTLHKRPKAHTFAADVPRYLKLQAHLASADTLRFIMDRWIARVGPKGRHRITPDDIRHARNAWLAEGLAAATINNMVGALRTLYRVLDGPRAESPADGIKALPVPRKPIYSVSDAQVMAIDAELQRRERAYGFSAKTRARFRVLVSTGKRPSELMRAEPRDVDLERRIWLVRDGKGGWSPGVFLNDDMMAAWRLFIAADAFGPFNHGSFARVLRAAGWPANVRVYNARHATWIAAVERGADMADVQQGAGHKNLRTTVRHYTGVRDSRMQRLSERLKIWGIA